MRETGILGHKVYAELVHCILKRRKKWAGKGLPLPTRAERAGARVKRLLDGRVGGPSPTVA